MKVLGLTAAVLMLFFLISLTPLPLHAAPGDTTLVRITPQVVTTTVALSTTVDILIENVSGLYGADVQLTFDPTLLTAQDANPGLAGVQIEVGPLLTSDSYFVVINAADNLSGTARLVMTQLNPTPPVSGTGVLARITFTPTGSIGASPIHFTQIQLASQSGDPIPFTAQDGMINVQSATPPKLIYLPLIERNIEN